LLFKKSAGMQKNYQEENMDLIEVKIKKGEDDNIILGQTHFIKSVEDLYEAIVNIAPSANFGVAFNEASSDRMIRHTGTNKDAENDAIENCKRVGAGHFFCIVLKDIFPIQVLNAVKNVSEVCNVFCASANPVTVIVAQTEMGRGVLGIIDGQTPLKVKGEVDQTNRKALLRKFGYKQ